MPCFLAVAELLVMFLHYQLAFRNYNQMCTLLSYLCIKIRLEAGSARGLARGVYCTFPDPLAGFLGNGGEKGGRD